MKVLKALFDTNPTVWIGAIQAAMVMALEFGWLSWAGLRSQDDIMLIVAVMSAVGAVILAFKTRNTLLAPALELFKALLAAAAIYGYHMSTDETASVVAFITVVISMFHWNATSPLKNGSFNLAA